MTSTLTLTRPRRWALAIGVPISLALIAYGGLIYVSLVGQDSFRVNLPVTPAGAEIRVGLGSGDLSVIPSSDDRAHMSGTVTYSIIRPRVRWEAGPQGTQLVGPGCIWVGNCGAELTLAVPPGRAVHASSGSGDVTASDVGGALTLYSDSGDVSVAHGSGPLVLGASSGDITGTGLSSAKVRANDDSGDVNLSFSQPPSEVTVNASAGDITVAVPTNVSYAVYASTNSGTPEIGVPTDSASHHVIRLSADSGNIYLVPSRT